MAARPNVKTTKIFVLDTNVIMHESRSLFSFEEHDVYMSLVVLEELDAHKKGLTDVARNVREATRNLDLLRQDESAFNNGGTSLKTVSDGVATGSIMFQPLEQEVLVPGQLSAETPDNQIIGLVKGLQKEYEGRQIVLVSKDINMRVKASMVGIEAQDYGADKVMHDSEKLYRGHRVLPENFWTECDEKVESWTNNNSTFWRVDGGITKTFFANEFLFIGERSQPGLMLQVVEQNGSGTILRLTDDFLEKEDKKNSRNVWGICARNQEQNYALNALLDPNIDFVTLEGKAGSGKTLLALAAGLSQVMDEKRYSEIIVTRATVSIGEEIGFLPGTEEEKMSPWMGALTDNLEVLCNPDPDSGDWGRAATEDLLKSRIKINSISFMRGRTFLSRYVIIDEAQNLTPKQMKALVTRAGPDTKIICLGNLAQIDTPYLTEGGCGLTYAVERFKDWQYSAHVELQQGERSRLADFAESVL